MKPWPYVRNFQSLNMSSSEDCWKIKVVIAMKFDSISRSVFGLCTSCRFAFGAQTNTCLICSCPLAQEQLVCLCPTGILRQSDAACLCPAAGEVSTNTGIVLCLDAVALFACAISLIWRSFAYPFASLEHV